jgi:hypothetical protein
LHFAGCSRSLVRNAKNKDIVMNKAHDRALLKQAIRDRLMALEVEELTAAKAHHEEFVRESMLDDREGHDKDDIAVSRENADLAAAFDAPVFAHHAKIDVIENLDFALTDTVQPGAVVRLKDRSLIVAVSTSKFDLGGHSYMGISTQSPMFKAMDGLKAGDKFDLNGRKFTIRDVL